MVLDTDPVILSRRRAVVVRGRQLADLGAGPERGPLGPGPRGCRGRQHHCQPFRSRAHSLEVARHACAVPDVRLVEAVASRAVRQIEAVASHAGLQTGDLAGAAPSLGPAELGLQALESRLRQTPSDPPERPDLEP